MDVKTLRGKRALVTGASSGLGAHFAQMLAENGVRVVLAARREEALRLVAARPATLGGDATTVTLDVSDADACEDLLAALGPLDILVNNAGIVREGAALDQAEKDWDEVVDTNLKGMIFVAKGVAKNMRSNGRFARHPGTQSGPRGGH